MKTLFKDRPDIILMLSAGALMFLGIIFIYSVSGPYCKFQNPPKPTWYFLMKQSIWLIPALIGMFIAYRFDYQFLVKISPILLVLSILALIAVFPLSNGVIKRWISVGPFTIQPSEFYKIALVVFMARMAAKFENSGQGYKRYLPALSVIMLGAVLIIREPDLGTTGLILAIIVSLLYLTGFKKRYLFIIPAIGIIAAAILIFVVGYEKDRIESYFITIQDPFNVEANYQTRQSLVSLGSGGPIGKGLGNGGQKHLFLPARHTDFIISAAAEEGGFMIVMIILGLFGLVGWSGYRIASAASTIEGSILAWGVTLMIMYQAIINIGVAFGLLPVTGMTLPFMSYGGSSLVACSIRIGMIGSVARRAQKPKGYFRRVRI